MRSAATGLAGLLALAAAVTLTAAGARAQAGGATAPGCSPAKRTGRFVISVPVAGKVRTALVNVPPGSDGRTALPLVLAFHGAGGSGRFMERFTGLTPVANRWGYVAVYPDAVGKFWQSVAGQDDIAFIGALLDAVEQSVCVDASRVYATGVSNGGGMVARLACELSDRLAAIAPVAGGPYAKLPPCHPDRPVAVLEIHGTEDAAVAYSQVPPFLQMWQTLDGCEARIVYTHVALRALGVSRPFCPGGVAVDHIEVLGGAHAWPGTPLPGPGHGSPLGATLRVMRFFAGRRVATP